MQDKIISAEEAVAIIRDGDTLANSGFVGNGTPDGLLAALAQRFEDTGHPRDLTLVFAAGQGDGEDQGLNRIAREGLLRRVVGGHWGLVPKLARLAVEERIQAWNLPQGCISHLYRDIAAGKPGLLTRVGLHTFVDPRHGGGRINAATSDELVKLMTVDGEEFLFFKAFPIQVAFLRATTADPGGNLSMERESLTLDNLAMAMAAKNSGGFVIAQVERVAARGTLPSRQVKIPGALVDCVVVGSPEHHRQTYATAYSPAFSGELRAPLESLPRMPFSPRKIIARRAAFELPLNGVVNLGIGMPEGVASVAAEEQILSQITLTAEPGLVGGMPASGLDFGAGVNADCIVDQNQQFDFYDGGGLDMACLGMAECDRAGNVNVSRFGPRLAGAGGFINISQNARRVVFAGTFTAGGLRVAVEGGRLSIVHEGRQRKFVHTVEQVTYSGTYGARRGQPVLYVTERCVFRLGPDGLVLVEVAPGIDVERDVLALMDFTPEVGELREMDPRIFRPEPMDLEHTLIDLALEQRIAYDAARDTLFLNFEGLNVSTAADVERVRAAVEQRCERIGHRVAAVVNYDGCRIAEAVLDSWAGMVRHLVATRYTHVSRYTTSAFMRLKLGDALSRREVRPHIFETREEAEASRG
jgi:propionate CoA-transferase